MRALLQQTFRAQRTSKNRDDFILENAVCKEKLGPYGPGDDFDQVILRNHRTNTGKLTGRTIIFIGNEKSISLDIVNWNDENPNEIILKGYEEKSEEKSEETEETEEKSGFKIP